MLNHLAFLKKQIFIIYQSNQVQQIISSSKPKKIRKKGYYMIKTSSVYLLVFEFPLAVNSTVS